VEPGSLFSLDGAAVSGADRIYEYQICDVQERMQIVFEFVGWRKRLVLCVGHAHSPWPKESEMQPDRRGAWSPVERECEWASAIRTGIVIDVGLLPGIGHEEYRCLGFVSFYFLVFSLFFLSEDNGACGGQIVDLLAIDLDRVSCFRYLV
jgi:hypothetical protein